MDPEDYVYAWEELERNRQDIMSRLSSLDSLPATLQSGRSRQTYCPIRQLLRTLEELEECKQVILTLIDELLEIKPWLLPDFKSVLTAPAEESTFFSWILCRWIFWGASGKNKLELPLQPKPPRLFLLQLGSPPPLPLTLLRFLPRLQRDPLDSSFALAGWQAEVFARPSPKLPLVDGLFCSSLFGLHFVSFGFHLFFELWL